MKPYDPMIRATAASQPASQPANEPSASFLAATAAAAARAAFFRLSCLCLFLLKNVINPQKTDFCFLKNDCFVFSNENLGHDAHG